MKATPAAEPFTREQSLGYQVNHLARLLAQALHRRIEPLGVVPGQFAQLLALFDEDGLTQSELCQQVRIEQPTMVSTLRRMERDALISRKPDPADGRRVRVLLTPRSRKLKRPLLSAARDVNAAATEGLTQREVTEFMRTLHRIVGNLERGAGR